MPRRMYVYHYIPEEAATDIETWQINRYLEAVKRPNERPANQSEPPAPDRPQTTRQAPRPAPRNDQQPQIDRRPPK